MNFKSKIVTLVSHALLIFISIIFILGMFILVGSIAGHIYDVQHAIPDPVKRGEDLGGAFVAIFYGAIAIIASFILSIIFYKRTLKRISSFIGCRL